MLAKLKTFSLVGIDVLPVEVEVDVSPAALPESVPFGTKDQSSQLAVIIAGNHRNFISRLRQSS